MAKIYFFMDISEKSCYYDIPMNAIIAINRHYLTYNVDWHAHEYTEVIYCTKGSGEILLKNGKRYPYHENEFIVISPNVAHSNQSEKGFENIYLMSTQTEFFLDECAMAADTPTKTIHSLLSQAYFFFNNPEFNTYEIMSSISSLLFNCIAAINKTLRFSDTVEKLRAEIIRKYANPNFKIKDVVLSGYAITESTQKSFKKELGLTPLQFLTQTRIHNAKQLLASRRSLGINITEIAKACGFEDVLYFSRVFKQHCGVSPLSYIENPD